jgi:hypothetical protein
MTETETIILQVACTRCGQICAIEHTPNPFITEEFVRTMLVCDSCHRKRGGRPEPQKVQASLPYKDT